jgi:hypothetical protein
MKKTTIISNIVVVLFLAVGFFSCNPIENDTRSGSVLVVESLMGTDMEDNEANYLQSDVIYEDPESGTSTIFADVGSATLSATSLDPSPVAGTSQYMDIKVTRYVISYARSDGNNTQGVDVPYSFEGYLSETIPIGTTKEMSFILVREVAKMEPPLVGLREGRDKGVLEVKAKVEFYGHDMAERSIKATGFISIFFANYSNEAGG